MLAGAGHDDGPMVASRLGEDADCRRAALQGEAGVHDVAAGQAVVEEAALLADRLRHLPDEGHHVVVGGALQLGDAIDVDLGPRHDRVQGGARDVATFGEDGQHGELDGEHGLDTSRSPTRARPSRATCTARSRPERLALARRDRPSDDGLGALRHRR